MVTNNGYILMHPELKPVVSAIIYSNELALPNNTTRK